MTRTEYLKQKINNRLVSHNQTITIIELTIDKIVLSNGESIEGTANRRLFIKRLTSKTDHWVKFFDDLMIGKISEKQIKSMISSIGGVSCQRIHGEKIRKNLNTGDSWNKGKQLIGRITKKGKVYQNWNFGKNKSNCETFAKMSADRRGEGNPMYGKNHSDEYKRQSSQRMKDKIASGQFTPNSNNRQTHYEVKFNDKQYRSSWEAVYHQLNPDAEYETLRIPYIFNGKNHIYIVDFINHSTKEVIEVKPAELFENMRTQSKLAALEDWAKTNEYTVVRFTQKDIVELQDRIILDEFDIHTQNKIQSLIKRNR